MGKRVYICSVELEYIVVADDSPEGKKKAAEMAMKEFRDDSCIWEEDFSVSRCSHIPGPYELDSDVSVDDGSSMTVAEAVKLPGGYDHEPAK